MHEAFSQYIFFGRISWMQVLINMDCLTVTIVVLILGSISPAKSDWESDLESSLMNTIKFNAETATSKVVLPAEGCALAVCSQTSSKISGSCLMDIDDEKDVAVYREQLRFGGDWLIILQRFDGSENFHLNWTDYQNGFGTVGQEFWLGLERLHRLTAEGSHELMVELEDFEGNYRYARYNRFKVGPESEDYPLEELGSYSGTAGDGFRNHKGAKFSTRDKGMVQCAGEFTGGWWYGADGRCFEVHPTGSWKQNNVWDAIVWKEFGSTLYRYDVPENLGLKFARMMIRKIDV